MQYVNSPYIFNSVKQTGNENEEKYQPRDMTKFSGLADKEMYELGELFFRSSVFFDLIHSPRVNALYRFDCMHLELDSHVKFTQEKIRGQRGTIRALAGICRFHFSYF